MAQMKVNEKRHSRSGRHVGWTFEFLPSEIADFPIRKTTKETLSNELWTNSEVQAKVQEALNTDFIQGIKNGNLDPQNYGKYTNQDAVYCYSATNNWKTLACRTSDDTLKAFFDARYKSYMKYTKVMFDDWCIARPDGIKLGDAGKRYADYEHKVATQAEYDPVCGIVAAIPCAKLWYWLANEIQGHTKNNVYQFWINDNLSPAYLKYDQILDDYASNVDKNQALEVYMTCMQGEVDFFRSATEERVFVM